LKTTLGGPVDGLLCDQRVLPERCWLKIPDYLSFEEAACLPVAGLTAWSALITEGRIGPGSRVLFLGTGGVSMMGLGIAEAMGAEVIITSSSDEKLSRARALGAHHTVNYRTVPAWSKAVRAIVPEGVDCVLEVGGDGTFDHSVRATRVGGIVALIGVLAARNQPVDLTAVLMRHIRVQGILVGSRRAFIEYLAFMATTKQHPIIDQVFEGLDKARSAFETMASGAHFGKLVIRV
jgi:NADPH:quinone reductase-like Zn-dependent oxidoreductase